MEKDCIDVLFKRESPTKKLVEEMLPLFPLHYQETSSHPEVKLQPTFAKYFEVDQMGMLRVFTVRDSEDNTLVGYATFFVNRSHHAQDCVQAISDTIFIKKEYRGNGKYFISWIDEQFKQENVDFVFHHVKLLHNYSKALVDLGYKNVELVFMRRLGVGKICEGIDC